MTQEQRSNAFRIAENLPWTGFSTVRVNERGRWISPVDAPMLADMADSLVFSWQRGYGATNDDEIGYRLIPTRNTDKD